MCEYEKDVHRRFLNPNSLYNENVFGMKVLSWNWMCVALIAMTRQCLFYPVVFLWTVLWCVFSVNYGYWDQFLHNKSDHKITVALESHCGVKLSTSFFIPRKLLNKSIHGVNVCGRRWMGSLRASTWSKGFTFGVGGWTRGPSETLNPLTYNLEADPCVLSLSICAEKCLLAKWGTFPGWPRSSQGSESIYLRTLWIFLQQTNKTSLSMSN